MSNDHQLELRRAFLRSVRDALIILQGDVELQDNDFQFFYIVDFAAIYSWVYKTSHHPFIRIPGESEEQIFARRQMALQTLFSGRWPLLLIPPYATELKNHLDSVSNKGKLAAVDAGNYRERLTRLIEKSELFQKFVRLENPQPTPAGEQEPAGGPPASGIEEQGELTDAAIEIGKEFFPELYAVLEFSAAKGGETLRKLFADNIVQDSDKALPECQDIDYSGPATDEWYQQINTMRDGVRPLQSLTDAMACAYVQLANERLNPAKKIIVFVSPSSDVESVLSLAHNTVISAPTMANTKVARDLTYCLLDFIHEENKKTRKADIAESLNTVTRLLEVYDSAIPLTWFVRSRREKAAQEWKQCENMLLMKDPGMIKLSSGQNATRWNAEFRKILEYLLTTFAQNKEGVENAVRKKLSDLYQETVELSKLIPATRTFEAFRSIMVTKNKNIRGVQLTFPGLQDELPIPIAFMHGGVKRLANRFKELHENFSEQNVMELRKLILTDAGRSDATPEHHLLAGYIQALEKRYDSALQELEAGLKDATDAERIELLYLSAAIHRKQYHAQQSADLLEAALAIEPGDARLHIEYAKALWLKWRESDRSPGSPYLNNALEHLAIATADPKVDLKPELAAQIENVSAFIHTERVLCGAAPPAAILEAEKHIRRLQEVWDKSKWIGRFFDTRSHFYYAKAATLDPSRSKEKQSLLALAAEDAATSLKFEEVGADSDVRREHQLAISQATVNLDESI